MSLKLSKKYAICLNMKYRIAYLFFEVLWPDLFSSLREGMILPSREYSRPITIVQSYAHERNLAKCDG